MYLHAHQFKTFKLNTMSDYYTYTLIHAHRIIRYSVSFRSMCSGFGTDNKMCCSLLKCQITSILHYQDNELINKLLIKLN